MRRPPPRRARRRHRRAARLVRLVPQERHRRGQRVPGLREPARQRDPPPAERNSVTRTTGAQARRTRTGGADATAARTRDAASPRTGARRTVMYYIKQLPAYLRLLGGLLTDKRVNSIDKLLVAGAIAYIALPIDFIPDFIPFMGEVDDVFLLVIALQRLVANAGRQVLL